MSKSHIFVMPKTITEGVKRIDSTILDKDIESCYINILHDEDLPKYIQLLNDNQMAALICFTIRKGMKSLKSLCNKRTVDKVGDGILCYDKVEAKTNSELADRRQAERDLYYEKPLFNIVEKSQEKKPEVKAEAIIIKADIKSKNDRVYSKEILENTVKESNTMKKSTSVKRREDIQKQEVITSIPNNEPAKHKETLHIESSKNTNTGLGMIRHNRKSDPLRNKQVLPEDLPKKPSKNITKKEIIESKNANIPGYISNYAAPMRNISMGRARFNEVKWLQNALNYCNNAGLKVDGKFGPKTDIAVKNFKLKNGLGKNNTVTGEVDRVTRDKIIDKCNKK